MAGFECPPRLWLLEATAEALCLLPDKATLGQWVPAVRLAFLLAVVLPLFLIGSFGPRWVRAGAIVEWHSRLRSSRDGEVTFALFLAIFVIVGIVATAAVRITPRDAPDLYNNSIWFLVLSKYVLWVFTGAVLGRLAQRSRPAALAAAVFVAALGLASLPSWMQAVRGQTVSQLDREQVALVRSLERACREGATVLGPPPGSDEPEYSTGREGDILLLAGCRVPIAEPWASQFVSQDDWKRRRRDVLRFWKAWRKGRLRTEILDRYDARCVVELVGEGHRPFAGLQPVFTGERHIAYAVPIAGSVARTPD